MAKNNEKKGKFQTHNKFKRHKLIIGSTVGRDCSITNISGLKEHGITCFQIMAEFDYNTAQYKPSPLIETILSDKKNRIILHMPFYFHFLQKPTQKYMQYFRNLNKYWCGKQKVTAIIGHCKGINKSMPQVLSTMISNIMAYANLCPHCKLLLENDAGSKINDAPTLRNLISAKEAMLHSGLNVGLCVDTQHAYAAGDSLFSINFRDNVDLIHLNAIPKNVKFGGHLDRHSKTLLKDSKNGTNFIRKILSLIVPGTPLILERTNYDIIINDIQTLKAIANEKIADVDKKTVGQAVQKGRKIFY